MFLISSVLKPHRKHNETTSKPHRKPHRNAVLDNVVSKQMSVKLL